MNLIKVLFLTFLLSILALASDIKKIVYITPDTKIPFWNIMSEGIKNQVTSNGYDFEVHSINSDAREELQATIKAIKENVSGIIVSPTNSSACVTILKLAKRANIPVVISDVGTDAGEYVSYISSKNKNGAYQVGQILANKMVEKNLQNGKVGIIAIPQKRLNGQARTSGFMQALEEQNIHGADIKQMLLWTPEETYNHAKEMINKHKDLKAIWLQTSNLYQSALNAIKESNKDIILVAFDAEPEFLDLIPKGTILASGMQQPYLMGEEAAKAMHKHLLGKSVKKAIQVPILAVSTENINEKLPIIKQNVLGISK